MAKVGPKTDALTTTSQGGAMTTAPRMNDQLPAHLREGSSDSMSLLKQYVTPPRLKVIQRQTLPPLIEQFRPGDVVLITQTEPKLIAGIKVNETGRETTEGNPFWGVPLYFYPEWVLWNPMEAKGTLSAIRSRTLDPRSDIARRSKSKDTWSMPCPEVPMKDNKPLFCRYVEHLNFVLKLVGQDNKPIDEQIGGHQFITLSYARGEHKYGTLFAGKLNERNAKDIFGCQFEFVVGPRTSGENAWLGINPTNPSAASGVDAWVHDPELFEQYKLLHEGLRTKHLEGLLQAGYDDGTVEGEVVSPKGGQQY